ncbi:embryonic stem cell-specific 5-hydroxymethylcytosine-binding protein isoform X2 [Wolffia australiana]
MCGRGRCTLRPDDVANACGVDLAEGGGSDGPDLATFRPSYNLSPGAYLPVVARRTTKDEDDGTMPVLTCMRWGLVPSFTSKNDKPDYFRMFNARSESIREKPSFRRLVPKNRCLVAMEGFYEWKKDGSKKQPYYIYFKDGRPLVFAALYDCWHNAEGESIYTFTILTTSSSSKLQWLHDRMPVILGDKSSINTWLNGSASESDSVAIPYEGPDLVWHPVTPAMGKTSLDGPECVKEVQVKPPEKGSIIKFFKKPLAPGDAFKKEEDESSEGIIHVDLLDKVQKSKTQIRIKPKEEEEQITKKRGVEKSISPALDGKDLKKQRRTVKDDGGGRATLLSYFGKS